MTPTPASTPRGAAGEGLLARFVHRAASASARRPRVTVLLWLALVAGCLAAGSITGTQSLTDAESGVGESGRADTRIAEAGLEAPAVEQILVRSDDRAATARAAAALEQRLGRLPEVGEVHGPADAPALSAAGGKTGLVQVSLRGDPADAADRVAPLEAAVAATAAAHPGVRLQQSGEGSMEKAIDGIIEEDLQRANVFSLPIILVILLLAFGAFVAAAVPLLLAVTSVAAAMGALGVVSQLVPSDDNANALVVLIGLAVGVDYSLFYIRREREERRAGKGSHAALEATAATVGRAVVISGLTVLVALAGLAITGLAMFTSMALATMLVVAIAVVGSVTVLPATLELLGDKVDRGRLPFVERLRARRDRSSGGAWGALARRVTRRPAVALVTAVCLLGALAAPTLDMHTAESDERAFPQDVPAIAALNAIERTFPGAPSDAQLVVRGEGLDRPSARARLVELGQRALAVTGGRGDVDLTVSRDARTVLLGVPMPDRGREAAKATIAELRDRVAATAGEVAPGADALVTGRAADDADFTDRMATATPIVIAFVLGLAFLLIIAAFRSPALAATVVGLNLLSVGAAYGVTVAVFQHEWAESLLDFQSTGTIASWLPLFAFVILFGLSMDYTILVLERMREACRAGRSAREAAADGVTATASTVTSAALIMVGVFSIFATMQFLDQKQLGLGLAVAVLVDATIVRGIALPAAVALLGERRWKVRPLPAPGRTRDDGRRVPLATQNQAAAQRG